MRIEGVVWSWIKAGFVVATQQMRTSLRSAEPTLTLLFPVSRRPGFNKISHTNWGTTSTIRTLRTMELQSWIGLVTERFIDFVPIISAVPLNTFWNVVFLLKKKETQVTSKVSTGLTFPSSLTFLEAAAYLISVMWQNRSQLNILEQMCCHWRPHMCKLPIWCILAHCLLFHAKWRKIAHFRRRTRLSRTWRRTLLTPLKYLMAERNGSEGVSLDWFRNIRDLCASVTKRQCGNLTSYKTSKQERNWRAAVWQESVAQPRQQCCTPERNESVLEGVGGGETRTSQL